ncbi:unnamed protein product [Rhizophagus irregularis]|nr:unnamed protein product [Rhizophagus irregularis]
MLQLDPTLTKDDRNWANIKNNLIKDEKKILMAHLDTVCYTCGTIFSQNDNGFKMELEDDSLEESSRK